MSEKISKFASDLSDKFLTPELSVKTDLRWWMASGMRPVMTGAFRTFCSPFSVDWVNAETAAQTMSAPACANPVCPSA